MNFLLDSLLVASLHLGLSAIPSVSMATPTAMNRPLADEAEVLDPLSAACDAFLAASEGLRRAVVADIESAIESHEDPGIRKLLALRDRARCELEIVPALPITFHHPKDYAPSQPPRRLVKLDSGADLQFAHLMGRQGAEPIFVRQVAYDFGRNIGVRLERDFGPDDALWNYLYGYVDGCDVLIAWLEQRLDHDDSQDKIAQHFAHGYADLNGRGHPGLTLYEAFAAFNGVAMPDVDVIAYARNIKGDDRWVSPIPPGREQSHLFNELHTDFLQYFRYRTLVEYMANLWMNPESPLDWSHETLRERILYAIHLDDLDIDQAVVRLRRTKDRGGFVSEIDALANQDNSWRWYSRDAAARINGVRWTIALEAHAALRKHGFLTDNPPPSAAKESAETGQ